MKLVSNNNGSLITTSKIISDAFNKEHRHVLRNIESLDCSDEFRERNFGLSSYMSPQNKVIKCYEITKDGFAFLCMGFTGKEAAKWKEKYIEAFNLMGESLHNIDFRMSKLSSEQAEIKQAGSNWSKMGREINKAKKKNKPLSDELVSEVQFSLGLEE